MSKRKTIKFDESELKILQKDKVERTTLEINPSYLEPYNFVEDIDEIKNEVSKLVSSVKDLQRKEKIEKRRRWRNAGRYKRR